jgi:hypothetical protein
MLFVVVGTDWIGLTFEYITTPDITSKIFAMRIIPTIIHIVGIASLAMGLFVVNPKPLPIAWDYGANIRTLKKIAWFLVILGFSMKIFSLYAAGITSLKSYFLNMYAYTIARGKYGGFWDKGLGIMIFGMGLLFANQEKFRAQIGIVIVAGLTFFALSKSRGGIISIPIIFIILLCIFNKKMLKAWMNPAVIVFVVLAIILGD